MSGSLRATATACVIRTSSPGKFAEYLAAGAPILAHVPAGSFVAWYGNRHACARVVDIPTPAALAEAIRGLLANPDLRRTLGENARSRAAADYSTGAAQTAFRDTLATRNPVQSVL